MNNPSETVLGDEGGNPMRFVPKYSGESDRWLLHDEIQSGIPILLLLVDSKSGPMQWAVEETVGVKEL